MNTELLEEFKETLDKLNGIYDRLVATIDQPSSSISLEEEFAILQFNKDIRTIYRTDGTHMSNELCKILDIIESCMTSYPKISPYTSVDLLKYYIRPIVDSWWCDDRPSVDFGYKQTPGTYCSANVFANPILAAAVLKYHNFTQLKGYFTDAVLAYIDNTLLAISDSGDMVDKVISILYFNKT